MIYGNKNLEPEIAYLGKIIFNDNIEEQQVGFNNFKSLGECEIRIYSQEGPIAHFHIVNSSGFDCCVEIFDNKFFDHGKHKDKLNSYQCRQLYEWMNKQSEITSKETNWEICRIIWNTSNPSNSYKNKKDSNKCPRYDLMK